MRVGDNKVKITQITFIAKNPKCTSIQPKRYLLNTENKLIALEAAEALLSYEKNADEYRVLPAVTVEVLDV